MTKKGKGVPIMTNESITIYKLIILYTLNKVNMPIPAGVISDYITAKGYTDYFTLQNAFGELLQADFIQEDTTYHLAYYTLTNNGKETLELFGNQLSLDIRSEIDSFLQEKRYEIADETSLVSDYHLTSNGSYLAICTLREGSQLLFELSLHVATEDDAIKVCENWKKNSDLVYQMAMRQLLTGEKDK